MRTLKDYEYLQLLPGKNGQAHRYRLTVDYSDPTINEYILDLINNSDKQLTIYMSDPTILSPIDLKAVPSNKRVWIFTSFDFTKKGKKWFNEIGKQVNINLRSSKGSKIVGILAVQDETQAMVLPEDIGFVTSDSNFVSYLLNLLNMLKGTSLRVKN